MPPRYNDVEPPLANEQQVGGGDHRWHHIESSHSFKGDVDVTMSGARADVTIHVRGRERWGWLRALG